MIRRLGLLAPYIYCFISKYELERNEPPLMVLLAYSRITGIPVENFIDDKLDLPASLR